MAITILDGMLLGGLALLFLKKQRKFGYMLLGLTAALFLLGLLSFGIIPLVK